MIVTEREAETQAEGGAGSMHREPDVGFDPGSPGSRPGPKTGAKREAEVERESQADSLLNTESDARLHPRTLRS